MTDRRPGELREKISGRRADEPLSTKINFRRPIAFDVEITMLQPPLLIDGGGMTNLAKVCDDGAE